VAVLGPLDAFGEVALLEYGPRTATVQAETGLELVSLDREQFLDALGEAGIAPERVTGMLRATHTLLSSEIFRSMSPGALARVVGLSRRERHPEGAVVIRQGESGDKFYVVASGTVTVQRVGEKQVAARMGPGDYFGEIALVTDAPRTATVTCVEPCELLVLDRPGFNQVLAHDFHSAARLEQIAAGRRG
jgi:cAMP-dependent protein kinase regulator